MKTTYKTIEKEGRSLFREKGSRFIGLVLPVEKQGNIKEILEKYRKDYHDARHHCYSYRLGYQGEEWRINDDGEPSGSAGKPIFGQLLSYSLTNTLAIVIRYFGGTKLGISGLINAYRTTTRDAILDTCIIEKEITVDLLISFEYESMNLVMRVIKEENLSIVGNDFGLNCEIHCRIPVKSLPKIQDIFNRINDLNVAKNESIKISMIND